MNMPAPVQPPHTEPALVSALRDPVSHLVFWTTAVAALALDLWSKAWAFSTLAPLDERSIISGWLTFRRSLNDGAVFGSFTGYVGVFVAASIAALLFVLYLFARSNRRQYVLHLALGGILAGALGNLYDRAFMQADVVRMSRAGQWETMMIGRVLPDSTESTLRVGVFPEGTHAQSFPHAEVRVHRQGVVRDFIKFMPQFPPWMPRVGGRDMWPWVFNVADSALVCGVIVMLLGSWQSPGRAARNVRSAPRQMDIAPTPP